MWEWITFACMAKKAVWATTWLLSPSSYIFNVCMQTTANDGRAAENRRRITSDIKGVFLPGVESRGTRRIKVLFEYGKNTPWEKSLAIFSTFDYHFARKRPLRWFALAASLLSCHKLLAAFVHRNGRRATRVILDEALNKKNHVGFVPLVFFGPFFRGVIEKERK